MNPKDVLGLGNRYTKKDLSSLLEQENIALVREGICYLKDFPASLFFVDLDKTDKKEERFRFEDYFEGEFFHWDTQTTQNIDTPKIKDIVLGKSTPHLFVRIKSKIKNTTQPFIYCGSLKFMEHEVKTANPAHIIFRSVDYDDFTANEDLQNIYLWSPSKIGKNTQSKISKKSEVSKERLVRYKKPNETERKGMITSRVGQGYYRQQIMEKWNGECPITGIDLKSILIASHIVPWKEATDEERLDVENGILLSPLYDSLFDRHLISFSDEGKIVISGKITEENRIRLGLSDTIKIKVTLGMIPYLTRHRDKLSEK